MPKSESYRPHPWGGECDDLNESTEDKPCWGQVERFWYDTPDDAYCSELCQGHAGTIDEDDYSEYREEPSWSAASTASS